MTRALRAEEAELLREELAAFAEATGDAEQRARLEETSASLAAGELPEAALEPIGKVLEVGLQTGRIRRIHRAAAETTLLRVFSLTPAGKAHAEALAQVNAAAEPLAGATIESLRVASRGPGQYQLLLITDRFELTLRFTPDGPGVESVGIGA